MGTPCLFSYTLSFLVGYNAKNKWKYYNLTINKLTIKIPDENQNVFLLCTWLFPRFHFQHSPSSYVRGNYTIYKSFKIQNMKSVILKMLISENVHLTLSHFPPHFLLPSSLSFYNFKCCCFSCYLPLFLSVSPCSEA